ncbi:MAG: hypothetical protein ACYDAC_01490 [Candidatus Dormibacteria bacterium]
MSTNGSRAFITFQSLLTNTSGSPLSVMTVAAFDGTTGSTLWLSSYLGPNPNATFARGSWPWLWDPIAASPDGLRVYAAGMSNDGNFATSGTGFTTVAFDAASGRQDWASSYNTNTPEQYLRVGPVVTTDPLGRAVYVTGPAYQDATFTTMSHDPLREPHSARPSTRSPLGRQPMRW